MSVAYRAAVISGFVRPNRPVQMATLHKYGQVAAQWEAARLLLTSGAPVPADAERFMSLTALLRGLTRDLALNTCTAENARQHGIAGITDRRGFLPRDPSRILDHETWQSAAAGW